MMLTSCSCLHRPGFEGLAEKGLRGACQESGQGQNLCHWSGSQDIFSKNILFQPKQSLRPGFSSSRDSVLDNVVLWHILRSLVACQQVDGAVIALWVRGGAGLPWSGRAVIVLRVKGAQGWW